MESGKESKLPHRCFFDSIELRNVSLMLRSNGARVEKLFLWKYSMVQQPIWYRYWGKAQKNEGSDSDTYHLLPYHCLDVAICGCRLLSPQYQYGKLLADQLEIPQEQLQRLFAFLLSIHDLGKFSRSFQNLVPNLSAQLVPNIDSYHYTERHDSLGFWVVKKSPEVGTVFAETSGNSIQKIGLSSVFSCWLQIVMGHHGQPPKNHGKNLNDFYTDDDISAAADFVQEMLSFWLEADDLKLLFDKSLRERVKRCSWLLAGLAVLADWQGSNQHYFGYVSQPMSLVSYRQLAEQRAEKAFQWIGLDPIEVEPFHSMQQLFPFIETPTPLQRYAIEQPLSNSPQLFIFEDVTGAGKTEAALTIVHRLLAKGLATGLYVGLPTMATANAMYQRLADCYQRLFQAGSHPSLVLSHGARHLSDMFRQSVMLPEQFSDQNYQPNELSASAYCNYWLADSRKKALLANVGVGTLDQALLSVLPARHQSLRLLGLAGKVLLVDEVHAYDAYMQTLLANLLKLHASQGGSCILLSATLPQTMKHKLVQAYADGLGQSVSALNSHAYPLATQFPTPAKSYESALQTRPDVCRRVIVARLNDAEQALLLIQQSVAQQKCVCWVRNTVDDARFAYQQLLSQGYRSEQLMLFHSRFAMVDRQIIEQHVLSCFGKQSQANERSGKVLIATQVVEQSLDLDFDVMISDLAPVDLLLQRAGRLHRHRRHSNGDLVQGNSADQRGEPRFYIVSPEPVEDASEDWLPRYNGSRAVYQDLALLWRSAYLLFQRNAYQMPDDARDLIEQVYSPDTELEAPEALLDSSYEAMGANKAAVSIANANALKIEQGYGQASNETGWSEELNVPTRLTDQTVSVVLVCKDEHGQWLPYAEGKDFPWELSHLSLRENKWHEAESTLTDELKTQLQQLQERTPALKWHQLFPLVDQWQAFYSAQQGWVGNK